jgi:hypothetical protein
MGTRGVEVASNKIISHTLRVTHESLSIAQNINMFKAANVIMAQNADPMKHRATVKGDQFEYTMVVISLFNFDQAAQVCKELVGKEGVQSIILCPGFTHEGVAKVRSAVGEDLPINVARGDVPSTMMTAQILAQEGWLPAGH